MVRWFLLSAHTGLLRGLDITLVCRVDEYQMIEPFSEHSSNLWAQIGRVPTPQQITTNAGMMGFTGHYTLSLSKNNANMRFAEDKLRDIANNWSKTIKTTLNRSLRSMDEDLDASFRNQKIQKLEAIKKKLDTNTDIENDFDDLS